LKEEVEMLLNGLYKVRRSSSYGKAKEVAVPPYSNFELGEQVVVLCDDGFMLVVPEGAEVDEELLRKAITMNVE
jgi:hypothetical protein